MGSSLSLFGANVGALNVLLGALFSFPVNLSLSLCFSGHVICSLAVLLFLLLTPLRTLTSCRPHVDLWPTSLSFFSLRLVVHFSLFFVLLKTPPFFKCTLCDRYPSHRLCTQHPLGGGRWPLLSIAVSVFWPSPLLYISLPLFQLFFSLSPTLSSTSLPILSSPPSCLSACARGWFHCHPPLCLHGDTGMKGWSHAGSKEVTLTLHWHLTLLDQQTLFFAWHVHWAWLCSLSLFLHWSISGD